jgi:hypothetical protein
MQRVQPSYGRNDTHEPDYHGFSITETGIREDEGMRTYLLEKLGSCNGPKRYILGHYWHAILDGTKAGPCHDNWLDGLPPKTAVKSCRHNLSTRQQNLDSHNAGGKRHRQL